MKGAFCWTVSPIVLPVLRWTSGVHNRMLAAALGDRVSRDDLLILMHGSAMADEDQTPAGAYKHAMRNGAANESVTKARQAWERFVYESLEAARRTGNRELALAILAEGMHALMDSTSPAHRGFQPWHGDSHDYPGIPGHVSKDNNPSGADSRATVDLLRAYYDAYAQGKPFRLP
jgi:hypothetical protein